MGKKSKEKKSNYWAKGLFLASVIVLFYVLIYLCFVGEGFIPTG